MAKAAPTANSVSAWTVVPASPKDLEQIRKKCRRLVARRAAMSAGMSAIPLPGLDIVTDLGMLASLIDDINQAFGLSPGQIDRLQPKLRLAAYEIIAGMGGVLVGKLITRAVVARLLEHMGLRMLVKHSARIVPVAGQIASAAIGFATFRSIGNQHIEACASVVAELSGVKA